MTDQQLDLPGIEAQRFFSRKDWVSACQFHDLSDAEILAKVCRHTEEKERPVVLLDLDSTLYNVSYRNLRILQEWAVSTFSPDQNSVLEKIQSMSLDQMEYSVEDTFLNLNLNLEEGQFKELARSAKKFWFHTFFTNSYLQWDRPYPGASEFVQKLHQSGAEIVYLTGRDEPNMGLGTRANLMRDGFPWEVPKTSLLMKPSFVEDDLIFKTRAIQNLSQKGNLVASFENEPPNIVALYDLFPQAMHVFVETHCSENLARVVGGIYRLRGYL